MLKKLDVVILAGATYSNSIFVGAKCLSKNKNDTYYLIRSKYNETVLKCEHSDKLAEQQCSFSQTNRSLLNVNIGDTITITRVEKTEHVPIKSLVIKTRPMTSSSKVDMAKFVSIFLDNFSGDIIKEHSILVVNIDDTHYFSCELSDFKFDKTHDKNIGILMGTTVINCQESESIKIKMDTSNKQLFKSDAGLLQLGIGGMSDEFSKIFRRIFASRLLPHNTIDELGINHVRGMMIHGPTGCGKTLLARQIGLLLNCENPKIVNGPELLNMYVGESEANTRKLFDDAVNDKYGKKLHVIICDEFDAICRRRSERIGNNQVSDNVVNTLLSYIDGIQPLNNILLICMTNRIDLIDPAMLRPGRIELQVEVALPDELGRLEILNVHTSTMKKNGYMDSDVDLNKLVMDTKYFTGAEIEGLVKSAGSHAIIRTVDKNVWNRQKPIIHMTDFNKALDDIIPMFGRISTNILDLASKEMDKQRTEQCNGVVANLRNTPIGRSTVILLCGPPNSGKTFVSAHAIKQVVPDYARIIDHNLLVCKTDSEKCQIIQQIFTDSRNLKSRIIMVDSFERLIEYCPIGEIINNKVLQTLLTMIHQPIPSENKMSIIVTCQDYQLLVKLGIERIFDFSYTLGDSYSPKSPTYRPLRPSSSPPN